MKTHNHKYQASYSNQHIVVTADSIEQARALAARQLSVDVNCIYWIVIYPIN